MLVITDGQRFGSVVSATMKKLDLEEGEEGDMMIMGGGQLKHDPELDDPEAEDESYKVEYVGQLLLGDRQNQKWLELFASNMLREMVKIPKYSEIQSLIVTIHVQGIGKMGKKEQMEAQKLLIAAILEKSQ